MRDLVDYANEWIFCYIAMTGKGYLTSMCESFNILMSHDNYSITNDNLISFLHSLISLLSFISYIAIIVALINTVMKEYYFPSLLFIATTYIYFNYAVCVMIDSGVKAVMFTYALFPDEVRKKDPVLVNAIENQKKEK